MKFSYEEFEYEPNKQISNIILSVAVPFLVTTFVITILTMQSLYQKKNYKMTYFLLSMLLLPTFVSQFFCFIFSILYLWKYSVRNELQFTNLPVWMWVCLFALYTFIAYVLVSVLLYFFADLTFFDISNQKLYQEAFCNKKDLQTLKILPNDISEMEKLVKLGYEKAKTMRVVFSFLARNSAYHVENMKKKIEKLGGYFKDYHVLIFENDSNDGTRSLLKAWSSENSHITVLDCCKLGNCECKLDWKKATHDGVHSKSRIDKMRTMRELLLDHLKNNYANWDYSIVMDFDLGGSIFIDGILTCFAHDDKFDVMFGSGLTSFPGFFNKPMLYDGWAYLADNDKLDSIDKENIIRDFFYQNNRLFDCPIRFKLKKAKSGFNGIAVYKISSILNASYIDSISKSNCEHIDLHLQMIQNGFSKIYYNPCMILFVGQQGEKRLSYLKTLFERSR